MLKAIAPISQSPKSLVEIGDFHVAKGEIKQAIKPYKNAIRLDKNMVDAYKKLIPLLIGTGDREMADDYYRQLLSVTSNHPQILNEYLTFRMAFHSSPGELDKTENELLSLVKSQPREVSFLVTLGILYLFYKPSPKKAQKSFEKALSLDPHSIDATNNLGVCFQQQKKYDLAISHYLKALEINKYYSPGYENLASAHSAQGKLEDALEYLEKAKSFGIRLLPNWDHAYGWLLLRLKKFEQAALWYEDKIKSEPLNNFLYNNLGVCYENLNKVTEAKIYYKQSVEIYLTKINKSDNNRDARALDAFNNVCRHLQKDAKYDELEKYAKLMIKLDPSSSSGHYYLGAASIQLKKYNLAKGELELSLRLNDNFIEPYIDLSYIYDMITHEHSKAVEILEKASSKGLIDELIINNLTYAYIKSGNLTKAKGLLDKAPSSPNIYATKGLAAFYEGNYARGNEYYKMAVEQVAEKNKLQAKQIWKYEEAAFWYRKNKSQKALSILSEAKNMSSEYPTYTHIKNLESSIKAELKSQD
jgi:tetratricopeptide (TPR) repeat protein